MPKDVKTKKKAEKNKTQDTKQRPAGAILCRVLVEVIGAPKEHIEKAIGMLVDKMYAEEKIEIISEETFEAKERGKLFSTFSELDIWFDDIVVLEKFMFDYTPSSVEVVEPQELTVPSRLFSGIMNDFLLRMHEHAFKYKDLSAHSRALANNTDAVIRNFLNYLLNEPKTAEEVSKATGIPLENAAALLDKFAKVGICEKRGDSWHKLKKGADVKHGGSKG
ncbi:TPA: hypothetical protein HA265_05875 [Candidatus Woesearchaeota archaeon]|nr:hypothetical protein [Candidatus Woesearchaeota archaeon]